MKGNMRRRVKAANEMVLRLCPSEDPAARSQLPLCTLPPSRGNYVLCGFDCRIVRRCDGVLGCYIRVPHTHELYGQTDLNELSLTLSCSDGITYSAAGADGWFIGSATQTSWHDAWALLNDLAEQLARVAGSDSTGSRAHRVSAVHLRLVR